MSVNKYILTFSQFEISGQTTTGATINLPLGTNFQLVDQDEIVQTKFVENEINKNINAVLDYDRVRFKPALINSQSVSIIDNIIYNVHFLNTNKQFNPYSYFGDIGFDNFDIKFRKKGFTKSFLRLSFYDTDVPTNQRLISFMTLYPKINFYTQI